VGGSRCGAADSEDGELGESPEAGAGGVEHDGKAQVSDGGADAYGAPFDLPAPTNGAVDALDDAYDSPFWAHAAAAPESGGEEEAGVSAASILGKVGGALGKITIGGVGGNLWERSSAVRQSLSSVTQDVASAMKEELAGVSSSVGDRVKTVSELVAAGSGSDDERLSAHDGPGANGLQEGGANWAGADAAEVTDLSQLQDMQEVTASEFEELDQNAFYSASLDAPTLKSATGAGDAPTIAGADGFAPAEGEDGRLGNGVAGLLGSVNMGSLNQVAGNLRADALLGGASKLGQVGSEWWGKSSSMREQLRNVTKDVASAMTEEVKGIASIITVDDDDDEEEEEEEEEERQAEQPRRRWGKAGPGAGTRAEEEDVARSPAGEGMHSLHAAEGMRMELEGLEMEREMLQARVANLEEENRELQDQLSAVLQEGSAQRMVLGSSDTAESGEREKEIGERACPALPPRVLEGALGAVEEAVAMCEKYVHSDSPLAATLSQLKASLTAVQQRDRAADSGDQMRALAGADGSARSGAGESAARVGELEERLREQEEERAKLVAQVGKMKEVCTGCAGELEEVCRRLWRLGAGERVQGQGTHGTYFSCSL
jgi:hypothetical protein